MKKNDNKYKIAFALGIFLLLEVFFGFIVFSSFSTFVSGGHGGNVTVQTLLSVGTVYPEILNMSIDEDASSITLASNSTKEVICTALIVDYNNETDFNNLTAVFYDPNNSTYTSSNDNNDHYTNYSCDFINDTNNWKGQADDEYHYLVNCTFQVQYYANPGAWNCSMVVTDDSNLTDHENQSSTINELLSVGLPTSINYGTVNSTWVSEEKNASVENMGNVALNLSLYGYGHAESDGNAMNCSLGSGENITIDYEKYRLNTSITGYLSLTEFEQNYTNLTSGVVLKDFDLTARTNDTESEAINYTYWRIYVPLGVAGTCTGNIVFGATTADGS